jgi:hypothetical protein
MHVPSARPATSARPAAGLARPAAALALLCVAIAGCLDDGGPAADDAAPWPTPGYVVPPPDFDFSTAIEEVHDHMDPSAHTLSYAMRRVGWDPLSSASDVGVLPGGHVELSVATDDDGRTWAFVSNWGPHRTFAIADVTDPAAPRHVSDFDVNQVLGVTRPGTGSYWGIAAFPDSDLVAVSAQLLASTPGLAGRDGEIGGGVYLVNTEDKGNPFMESFTPMLDPDALIPVGVHTVRTFHVGDVPHVAATSANGATTLYEVVGNVGARTLEVRSVAVGVHDTTVQVHPLTGQTLLYGAQGGVQITDISDPAAPEVIGSVPNGPELSAYHLIVPSDVLIDGRHYTVSGTETTEGPPPFITILDTTDPRAPTIVSTWQTPFDEDLYLPGPYRWATHNFDFDHGRIILGHYHAGVWVIDVSSPQNVAAPVTLGFYQPNEVPLFVPRTPLGIDVPAVWTALQHTDGLIYVSDVNTGLYILEFTGIPSPLVHEPVFPHNQR